MMEAKTQVEYKAVKLSYSSDAESAESNGILGGQRGVDLSPVNELVAEGWEVHTFSFDDAGCWQEAIMVREEP